MAMEADWLQWHEDRWNLPPSQGGRQEYAPNGPPRGIVPFPLTDAEFDLLLKRFFLADDMLTDAQADGHEILDTETAQTLRGKLMEWVEAYGKFPVFADTEAASYAYQNPLDPDKYYEWRTVAQIKANMPYVPANQLQDDNGVDLPDDFPVLMLAHRKYGGFGGVIFYHDDWPDTANWAAYFTKASDFINIEHPEYHDWLIENGGYVSDTDLVLQIHLTRKHFLSSQYVIDFIVNLIQQNLINFTLFNPNIIIKYPSSPPGGSWPPGTDGGPTPDYIPPPNPGYTDHLFNCDNNHFYTDIGTDNVVLAGTLNFIPMPTLPIPVADETDLELKHGIDTMIVNNGIPSGSNISEVEICVVYAGTGTLLATALGFSQASMTSKLPAFTVTTDATATPPNEVYTDKVPPTDSWETQLFKMNLPNLPGVTVSAQCVTVVSDSSNHIIFDDWEHISSIKLNYTLLPGIFGPNNNIFDDISNSPVVQLGLYRVRVLDATWRGVGYPVDVDSPCLVGNITPGFLQDAASWDWKNSSGDTQDLFSGVNWISDIDAVLIETYSPSSGQGLWMPASGSSSQGIEDAWRNINPEAHYDASNNLIIYSDTYATNQIQYTWLRVPNGQTNFAVDVYPIPFNGWVKIVAFHNSTTGQVTIQDAAHKCSSLTYPAYPAYPF